jgi:signal transduction histidine kinase
VILRRTTWLLTLSFALVQLALFGAFAIAVYAFVTSRFDFDAAEGGSGVSAEASFATLRAALLWGFAGLVVLVPATSHLLATLAMRPVRRSFEAQQRFVDDASHELRTPLTAIQAKLELTLLRPRNLATYEAAIREALESSDRLARTLEDLLMLSRTEREAGMTMELLDMAQVIDETIALDPSIETRVTSVSENGLTVRGSSGLLERAILNLLTNAVRYSGPDDRIEVRAVRQGNSARVEVQDYGIGMTPQEVELAFDRFWRADSSRASDGNGLGLSIVRQIARLHSGYIEIVSKSGAGTTATLRLPLSR